MKKILLISILVANFMFANETNGNQEFKKIVNEESRIQQRSIASEKAKIYIEKRFANYNKELCEKAEKEVHALGIAICRAKAGEVKSAIKVLDNLVEIKYPKAYCLRTVIRLMDKKEDSLSKTSKDVMFSKSNGIELTEECLAGYAIATAK